ncbi:uncharacterized protein EI90DRAFT_3059374 [Cantharellus anzutake]|uniref:uncharacterized protein n=1 Tax=Cantharellus anzutake TaxID=1750568 RepID=UPI0019059E84|nr:uncharacterized protein EI90DRAFT_3059374 [Cantharellus anzutake]KAF8330820.1 hypothetical protein EI90DRAFT_3059374 [Cantharellus anzutake]
MADLGEQPQGLQEALIYSKLKGQKRPQRPPQEGDKGQPPHKGRTIILCFDGTSNEYHDANTNVVRLFTCFEKSHPKQLVYYQTGIGTATETSSITPRGVSKFLNVLDQGIAFNLGDHICDGYRFLQQHWREGDKICVFGFSRGAYTARALAGMLQTVGLLHSSVPEQVEFAYKLYVDLGRSTGASRHPSRPYKREFSRSVTIDFLGVWDTVSSVGVLFPQSLPFSQSSRTIKVFRHALALDERRVKFIPSSWQLSAQEQTEQTENGIKNWKTTKSAKDFSAPDSSTLNNVQNWFSGVLELLLKIFAILFPPLLGGIYLFDRLFTRPKITKPKTRLIPAKCLERGPPDVKEVWFAGGHNDIGGGNAKDFAHVSDSESQYIPALSNISLRWMIRELYEADQQYDLCIRWLPTQLACFGIYLPTETNDDGGSDDDGSDDDGSEFYPTLPSADPPVVAHYDVPPQVTAGLKANPRRAKFKVCLAYNSGVLIDVKYHHDDTRTAITDELKAWKTWDRIRYYEGMKEWKPEHRPRPNLTQFFEWVSASLVTLFMMLLWWALELWPYVRRTRDKMQTKFWQSRFEMIPNGFSSREIPSPGALVNHRRLAIPEQAQPGWISFIDKRKTMFVHNSVVDRTNAKELGYRPRPWKTKDVPTGWKVTY